MFQTRLPATDPWNCPFSVSWYEPKILPGNFAALRWHGRLPTSLENCTMPVAHESACCAAPMMELPESWPSSRGPLVDTIASRVAGLATPTKPTQRLVAAGAKIVEKSPAEMSLSGSIV